MKPRQNFRQNLGQIAVNRDDPCELVRELISNSYDANARQIKVAVLPGDGLLFFDDGDGLSDTFHPRNDDLTPWIAFFSIGDSTKQKGAQIGYKCQGSKLCFASRRFGVLSRCEGESDWRWLRIENPKLVLDENFDLTPHPTDQPWKTLQEEIVSTRDNRTSAVLNHFGRDFFQSAFKTGTLLYIDGFEAAEFGKYFSCEDPTHSYLYNYIRFYTAHGDVRRLAERQGFEPRDIRLLADRAHPRESPRLQLWMDPGVFQTVPAGFPYLDLDDSAPVAVGPVEVNQLRAGRFHGRYASTIRHDGGHYEIVLAVDGKRRALEKYVALSRQGRDGRRSGVQLSKQRGAFVCSHGVRICSYNELFDSEILSAWRALQDGTDHFALMINGDFDLTINRNGLSNEGKRVLQDPGFVGQIGKFFDDCERAADGRVLKDLAQRLRRETFAHEENSATKQISELRERMRERAQFRLAGESYWNFSPLAGEEHFVGALFTMLAAKVPVEHALKRYWPRPITFSGQGIDALAVVDETRPLESLLSVEYKFAFSLEDEYNHLLHLTNLIVCWSIEGDAKSWPGTTVRDQFLYEGTVKELIEGECVQPAGGAASGATIGMVLRDIRDASGREFRNHEVRVVQLKALIDCTFDAEWRAPTIRGRR